jgi:hypothetical protein
MQLPIHRHATAPGAAAYDVASAHGGIDASLQLSQGVMPHMLLPGSFQGLEKVQYPKPSPCAKQWRKAQEVFEFALGCETEMGPRRLRQASSEEDAWFGF